MKIFDPKVGGHPLKLDDLRLIQDSYTEGFKAFTSFLSPTLNVILSGAIVTDDGTTITCSEGYACWQGEPFLVVASEFPKVLGQQLFFKLVEQIIPPSPVQYRDLSNKNVHIYRKLELVYFTTGVQGEYYTNFSRADATGVRPGTILEWFGNVNTEFDSTGLGINSMIGYAVCNGINQTPDLRGLFIVAATNVPSTGAPSLNPALGSYAVGDPGGFKAVQIAKENLPDSDLTVIDTGHEHLTMSTGAGTGKVNASTIAIREAGLGGNSSYDIQGSNAPASVGKSSKTQTGIQVKLGGSNVELENRPPYFALVRIMKL